MIPLVKNAQYDGVFIDIPEIDKKIATFVNQRLYRIMEKHDFLLFLQKHTIKQMKWNPMDRIMDSTSLPGEKTTIRRMTKQKCAMELGDEKDKKELYDFFQHYIHCFPLWVQEDSGKWFSYASQMYMEIMNKLKSEEIKPLSLIQQAILDNVLFLEIYLTYDRENIYPVVEEKVEEIEDRENILEAMREFARRQKNPFPTEDEFVAYLMARFEHLEPPGEYVQVLFPSELHETAEASDHEQLLLLLAALEEEKKEKSELETRFFFNPKEPKFEMVVHREFCQCKFCKAKVYKKQNFGIKYGVNLAGSPHTNKICQDAVRTNFDEKDLGKI